MHAIPVGAKRYFKSHPLSAVPRGQRREHKLRSDVWSRIRVIDGSLALVDACSHARSIVGTGEQIDVEPGISHHLEPIGPQVRFVVQLYRFRSDALASDDVARWENEGGRAPR